MQEQLKKKDEEMLEAEGIERRLAERKREKELREREDRLMEERRHRKWGICKYVSWNKEMSLW